MEAVRSTSPARCPGRRAAALGLLLLLGITCHGRELSLLTWAEYLDPALVTEFEQRHGVTLRLAYFDSDEERDGILLSTDGTGYDLVLVGNVRVATYRNRGWLAPLGEREVPALRHVERRWLDIEPAARGYAAPYFWGTIGIVYRRDLVATPPRSWLDLLRPPAALHRRITMLSTRDELWAVALKALGHSVNEDDPRRLAAAVDLLLAQKPHVLAYTTPLLSARSDLVSGDVAMAMAYSGDALMLYEFHPDIAYAVPEEGGPLWVDYLAVSSTAREPQLAYAFVDFLNQPANAARLAEYVNYATPNRAARRRVSADYRSDPVINPDPAVLARAEIQHLPPSAVQRVRNEQIARVLN